MEVATKRRQQQQQQCPLTRRHNKYEILYKRHVFLQYKIVSTRGKYAKNTKYSKIFEGKPILCQENFTSNNNNTRVTPMYVECRHIKYNKHKTLVSGAFFRRENTQKLTHDAHIFKTINRHKFYAKNFSHTKDHSQIGRVQCSSKSIAFIIFIVLSPLCT